MGHFAEIHFCLERSSRAEKWVCIFYTKNRDSFDNCLIENDVIPTLEDRQKELAKVKHRKLIMKTDSLLIID